MALASINAAQIEWVIQQVAAYIARQSQTFAAMAVPLNQNQKTPCT